MTVFDENLKPVEDEPAEEEMEGGWFKIDPSSFTFSVESNTASLKDRLHSRREDLSQEIGKIDRLLAMNERQDVLDAIELADELDMI
jgi:hypothetical protein